MSAVFISYRRANAALEMQLIAGQLRKRIKPYGVLSDQGDILPGDKYPEKLREMLARSSLVLLVIDDQWSIKGPDDWVGKEIEMAMAAQKEFLPVLVRDASVPKNQPENIQKVFHHIAFKFEGNPLDPKNPSWKRLAADVKRLLRNQKKFDAPTDIGEALVLAVTVGVGLLGLALWLLWIAKY